MKNLTCFTCLFGALLCFLPTQTRAQTYKNAVRLNVLNFTYRGVGIAYERKTFNRQSVLLEYSQANFRTAQRESQGLFDFSNTRWNWRAAMAEYRFYHLDGEEIENFHIYTGLYVRYASNITTLVTPTADVMYGKTYQAGDAYKETSNTMWGGGLTVGLLGQIAPKWKVEIGLGYGIMRILKERVRDDWYDYISRGNNNYAQEDNGNTRGNARMNVTLGYCF